MAAIEPFLLQPGNRAFVEGRDARPQQLLFGRVLGSVFLVVCLVPLTAGVLLMIGFATWEGWKRYALQNRAAEAKGVIESRHSETDDEGDTTWHVRFRFQPAPGAQPQSAEQSVTQERYGVLAEGTEVTVRFVPDQPSVALVAPASSAVFWVVIASTFGFTGLLLLAGYHPVREALRGFRLARRGILLTGRIVRCEGRSGGEGSFRVRIDYEVETPNGTWVAGTTAATRNDLAGARLPQPGERVSVLYADERTHAAL